MPLDLIVDPIPLAADADGVMRIGDTRVTLDTLVAAYRDGASLESIVEQYPALQMADVYSVLGYYLRHQDEVHAYLQERSQQAGKTRQENEARHPPIGVRERLQARRVVGAEWEGQVRYLPLT